MTELRLLGFEDVTRGNLTPPASLADAVWVSETGTETKTTLAADLRVGCVLCEGR